MKPDSKPKVGDETEVLCHWSARKLKPTIVLYVAAVFAAFMALAYFGFHSMTGVKALAMAAIGSIVSLVPGLGKRVEYRLTEHGLERRPHDPKKPGEFKRVFRSDELSHVAPTRGGFKFHKRLDDPNPLRRFWKTQISDAYSGEVQVETPDRERVLEAVAQRGISVR